VTSDTDTDTDTRKAGTGEAGSRTDRLSGAFATAKAEGRAALVGYLPAGFPTVPGSIAAMQAMVEGGPDGGIDVLEIGLPYSDPLMDGPTIQEAVQLALARGTRTADVLHVVEALAPAVPTLVMSSWNPIEQYGAARFAADLALAGGVGAITPDLVPEEAGPWTEAAAATSLAPVFLVAPSSTDARIRVVAEANRGFIYVASTMGVTGARAAVDSRAAQLVARVRPLTDLPLAVGLGVSNGRQAAEVAAYADGVIVGSAFVRALLDAPDEAAGVEAVRVLAGELATGVRAR
jgi:tryptophan synthase alpha chain